MRRNIVSTTVNVKPEYDSAFPELKKWVDAQPELIAEVHCNKKVMDALNSKLIFPVGHVGRIYMPSAHINDHIPDNLLITIGTRGTVNIYILEE